MLLAGAALSHNGPLSLPFVIVTAIAGATLGDNLGFFIGRRGGRRLVERYGARIGVTPDRLQQFDEFFVRPRGRTAFVARFITGLRVVCAVLAGASEMRWPSFILYNAGGAITWCTVIGLAGYALSRSWELLERWIGGTSLVGLVLVLAAAVIYFL